MEIMGKQHGVMLGYTEVLGVLIFSYLERSYVFRETGLVAPLSFYPLLTACLMGSSALSNISLNYINFPTKVVFRSSKLIPTMLISSLMHQRVFDLVEYTCALAICTGLVMFAAADWELAPSFHPIGLILVTLSVFADAILPNAQERLFSMGASRLEVTLYTNLFALMAYTVTTFASGDLQGAIILVARDKRLAAYYIVYIVVAYCGYMIRDVAVIHFCSHFLCLPLLRHFFFLILRNTTVAISMHMNVVKRFGGVAAVLVATGRKGMTLILSFLLFPKAFSWFYPIGAALVLGSILVASLHKMRQKKKSRPEPLHRDVKSHNIDVQVLIAVNQRQ